MSIENLGLDITQHVPQNWIHQEHHVKISAFMAGKDNLYIKKINGA